LSTAARALPRNENGAASTRRLSPNFFGAVGGETLKISRQRATWVMVGAGVVLFFIVLAAMVSAPDIKTQLDEAPSIWYHQVLNIYTTVFDAGAGIFLLIAAARLVGMEYSGGTIRVILGRGMGRLQLLTAKLVALALTGVLVLVGFLVASSIAIYLVVLAWKGSFSTIATLPSFWHDLGVEVGIAALSVAINILLGASAAVIGRSFAFGIGAALAFFPADNFGTIVMSLLYRLTHQTFWQEVTAYFLGPNLNVLQAKLIPGLRAAFAQPLVQVTTAHVWIVIAVWTAAFLAVSLVLTARRDVLQ
jgi:ABC-type transport system involved in multi-copper enzyme maturation permease subunit